MGIENLVEDAAGAFAADKGLEAVDPNAGLLAKGVAAVAGVEGAGLVRDFLGGGDQQQAQASDDQQPADDGSQGN